MSRYARTFWIVPAVAAVVVVTAIGAAKPGDAATSGETPGDLFQIPAPQVTEHQRLHEELRAALGAGGRTAEAARKVQQHLAAHFHEENELVMPMLGLLRPMAETGVTEAMRPAVVRGEQIEQKLDHFLAEHEKIHAAVDELEAAAEAEHAPEHAAFARRLRTHAQAEEAVLYPAAILIGRHVRSQLEAD